jgi:hypothetical protein
MRNLRATELQFMECEVTVVMRDCVRLAQLGWVNWSCFVYPEAAARAVERRTQGTGRNRQLKGKRLLKMKEGDQDPRTADVGKSQHESDSLNSVGRIL